MYSRVLIAGGMGSEKKDSSVSDNGEEEEDRADDRQTRSQSDSPEEKGE